MLFAATVGVRLAGKEELQILFCWTSRVNLQMKLLVICTIIWLLSWRITTREIDVNIQAKLYFWTVIAKLIVHKKVGEVLWTANGAYSESAHISTVQNKEFDVKLEANLDFWTVKILQDWLSISAFVWLEQHHKQRNWIQTSGVRWSIAICRRSLRCRQMAAGKNRRGNKTPIRHCVLWIFSQAPNERSAGIFVLTFVIFVCVWIRSVWEFWMAQ